MPILLFFKKNVNFHYFNGIATIQGRAELSNLDRYYYRKITTHNVYNKAKLCIGGWGDGIWLL